jgi:hypothetical protein
VAAIEKLAGAADALAFEHGLLGLSIGQLKFRAAMRQVFG